MMFSRDLRDRVASGEVMVSIRLWSRPQVKVGGRYQTAGVVIEIDSLEVLPFSAVTADDLAASGEEDLEALRDRAAHSGPIGDDTLVHRVEFHVV
ncbi:MAG: ASCH domain-containing protein [Intrasporangium sp.]|uniref:ASCH domain-containing protein n=1 Tax=Intrasporangium sp. TaxID=1925024 RepID=UPI002647B543|nr:ASCH domain-containing protein [Intrasporangium sp.]MDN5798321.1 ASCH domain-containing protein [Intrasporangium sp.]